MSARKQIIPIFIPHLGCPHDCVFCNQKRISGSLLPAAPEDVRSGIEEALKSGWTGEAMQLAFYGGSFTAIPAEEQVALLEAAQPYLESGKLCGIRLSTRPDAIDEGILTRLKSFGVDTIELGTQSLDDDVLYKSGRGHSAEDTRRASRLVKDYGFTLILQMMTGLPGSSAESDIETAREIVRLHPDGVRIYPTVIIKDTELFDMWQRGEYEPHSVEDAVSVCSRIVPLFDEAGISIIRLGLNPTEELSDGSAVAGAYHPALGELVRSRIIFEKARDLVVELSKKSETNGKSIVFSVHPSQLSQLIGQHRGNIEMLKIEFGLEKVKVIPDGTEKGKVVIKELI